MYRIIVFLYIYIGFAMGTDYCSSSLCSGSTHIACGNNGQFDSSCPAEAALVNIDGSLKDVIVGGHNAKRNIIAGGGDVNHQPACRMATMQWDDELASLAALNVRQCTISHDKCHNTDNFKFSGQNLALMTFHGEPNFNNLFKNIIDMWYDEKKNSNMNYINSFPNNYKGPAIGHFTVMMADRNIRMGCAAVTYPHNNAIYGQVFLVACNYATTNMVNNRIYASCSTAGSSCTAGKNPQYPNLCSVSEIYEVNKWP